MPRPRGVDDGGAALARNCGAVCLGLRALGEEEHDDEQQINGGNTHAWVQCYVPGPGWVDFDPSAGVVGNENLIRVAVAEHPRDAIPLQGTWYGSVSDHIAMEVGVSVKQHRRTEPFSEPDLKQAAG